MEVGGLISEVRWNEVNVLVCEHSLEAEQQSNFRDHEGVWSLVIHYHQFYEHGLGVSYRRPAIRVSWSKRRTAETL